MLRDSPLRRFAKTIEPAIDGWAPVLAFAALPTLGLVAGPSYSSMVIGLAAVQLLFGLGVGRGLPAIDRPLAVLAGLFLALCWVSAAWSIVPRESVRAALGLTGVLVAMLVFLAGRYDRPELVSMLFRVLVIATLVGVAVACLDRALGYKLESAISTKPGVNAATKYNRGSDYLMLVAWPVLAHAWWRRRWWTVCVLVLGVGVMLSTTLSLAAQVAVGAGAVVLVLAWAAPRLVAIGLAWGVAAYVVVLPLALRLLAEQRAGLARFLKPSGVARLEIWDYMTARVSEHPIRGWGLRVATYLPIHPDELSRYVHTGPRGIYPHNQWLELWVELGALGAALGLVFALLVLRRIGRLPEAIRPFAFAAFASAMAVASVDYEVVTDSWWSALAASAVLFGMLGRCHPVQCHLPADRLAG
jgi:exopolysaccharide production protein ExoQ